MVKKLGGSEAAVSIFWYYRRLMAMRPGEIIWRLRRMLWQCAARILHNRWERQYQNNFTDSENVIDKIEFYGLADIKPGDVPQDWIKSTIAVAEELLQNRSDCLALRRIDLGKEINWNREYKRGINTPLQFGPWMNYRDTTSYGDFKYFWELPRLQHLIILSKAYYLTGKEKYAEETIKQVESFVKQSPYLLGVNWIMPMEASIRLISISWVTAFLKEYLRRDKRTCSLIENIVRTHVDYVAKNFSAYSSANNHLIAEAAGVFIASTCFSQLDRMNKHRRNTYDILCREIGHQFYPDGVNKEQTTHYHIACYDCFLLAGLLGKNNGVGFPAEYWKTLEKAADFVWALANNDNSIPQIGDSDDGRMTVLSETKTSEVQSLLATASVLFDRPDFKATAKYFDETSFWLLGKKGKSMFEMMLPVSKPNTASVKFEEGGYYILHNNRTVLVKLIFDCGPLGFGSIAAHGHADSLSFILYAYGLEFFTDPGTYTYISDSPYRDYFRSTAAHNTIVIDGLNQSQIEGPFLWTQKADSFVKEWVSNEHYDKVAGWHNGYHRLHDPVTHRRVIKFEKKQEIITLDDYLEMKSSHKIEQYFHLAPSCDVENTNNNIWKITKAGRKIELIIDNKLNCRVYTGSENPICGWFSCSYDRKQPIHTIVCYGTFRGNQHFTTNIRLAV